MKKIIGIIITILLMTILGGCGSNETNTDNKAARTNIEPGSGDLVIESGTKGVSDTNYMNSFWWGFNFETANLKDGVYRGAYIFPSEVAVQFTINGNKISNLEYLSLKLEDKDYLKDETFKDIKAKYEAVLQHLEGKDVRNSLSDLYSRDKLPETVDNSVEVGKIISAIHDAFNRGVFYMKSDSGT